jgi:glutaminyl-tRNA synthetase
VTPEALRDFAELIGISKNNSLVDIGKLEYAVRGDLEGRSPRALAVLDPLPVVVTDWPEDRVEELDVPWWPGEPERGGSRKVPFGQDLLIERDDFSLAPPRGWKRLAPGREVRLAGAYVLRCEEVVRGPSGEVAALRCTHARGSRGEGQGPMGTIHWVHASRSIPVEVRLYDRLFRVEQPDAEPDLFAVLNPESLRVMSGARAEPALSQAAPGDHYQFLRQGYFFADPADSRPGAPVFNRTIALKDTWSSKAAAAQPEARQPAPRREPEAAGKGAPKRTRADARAEQRAAVPALAAAFARYRELGLSEEEADLLSGDAAVARYFDDALSTRGNARAIARWLLNDLLGLAREGGVGALPLPGSAFGRFVALADAGRLTAVAGKALLASLAERGGEPEERMRELGLERAEDPQELERAVARVLERHAGEAARFRKGEAKLFGVFLGAVMKETQGTQDPALVRRILQERLGGG